jgi:hypothetical protein
MGTEESRVGFPGLLLLIAAHSDAHMVREKPSHRTLALQSRDGRPLTLSHSLPLTKESRVERGMEGRTLCSIDRKTREVIVSPVGVRK